VNRECYLELRSQVAQLHNTHVRGSYFRLIMTKDYCPFQTAVAVREQGAEGDVWTQSRGGNRGDAGK